MSDRRSQREEKLLQEEKELEELIAQRKAPDQAPEEKEEKAENLSPEEATFKKRYGDLRALLQKKEQEWEEKFKKFQEQGAKKTTDMPLEGEELEAWVKNNPDISRLIKSLAKQEANAMMKALESDYREVKQSNEERARQKALNEILKVHPDFEEINDSKEFHDWADEQTPGLQSDLYDSNDPKRIIKVVKLYKADMGLTDRDFRKDERESARDIPTTLTTVDTPKKMKFKESQVAKMSDKEYARYSEQIDEAMRTGNFEYDISGGAR